MRRRWRFRAWPEAEHAELVDALEASADERQRAVSPVRGLWMIEHFVLGSRAPSASELRALVHDVLAVDAQAGSHQDLLRLVDAGLRSGRLLVVPVPYQAPRIEPREKPIEPEWTPFVEDTPLDWIEIQLVDEAGVGVPNERYVVLGPDGRSREGRTDAAGQARFERVEKGVYRVRFPNLDQEAVRPS
jgi:hypothetical protein